MLCNRRLIRALTCRRGSVAVEFAFVGTALITLLVGFLHVAFCLYAQSVLDQMAAGAARNFQVGKSSTAPTKDEYGNTIPPDFNNPDFKTAQVCYQPNSLLDCNAIKVYNYAVNDYASSSSSTTASAGSSKATMVLTLVYTSPIPVWPVLATNTPSPFLISSTIPYVNEY